MKIKKVTVIGLGYVGLPILIESSKHYNSYGFDLNKKRIREINKCIDINLEVSKKNLSNVKNRVSFNPEILSDSNIIIITVPTPVKKNNKPDLKFLSDSFSNINKYCLGNCIICVESTVYPGVTESIFQKKIKNYEKRGFKVGYSPERINPGDKKHKLTNIPKIVSSNDKYTLNTLIKFYSSFIKKIIKSNSIKEAEMAKVIENSQRDINVAFINEVAKICSAGRLNIFDTLNLAKTKWNFLDFKPGLVGGHCISVDPYYLYEYSKNLNLKTNVIISGRKTNENAINNLAKLINGSPGKNILFLGVTFKANINDTRNSGTLKTIKKISNEKNIFFYDEFIETIECKAKKIKILNNQKFDTIVYSVDHSHIKKKFDKILKENLKDKGRLITLHKVGNISNKIDYIVGY